MRDETRHKREQRLKKYEEHTKGDRATVKKIYRGKRVMYKLMKDTIHKFSIVARDAFIYIYIRTYTNFVQDTKKKFDDARRII